MNHYQLLESNLPEHKRAEFRKLVDAAQKAELSELDDSFLGFIDDYVHIAAILKQHTIRFPKTGSMPPSPLFEDRSWTVYDVGCAEGFQHVLFGFADRYVGIDAWFSCGAPTPILDNAEFVKGRFAEVAGSLKINRRRSFGIANMSLAYCGRADDLEAFDRLFLHKFMI